jgi:hypothetical protein
MGGAFSLMELTMNKRQQQKVHARAEMPPAVTDGVTVRIIEGLRCPCGRQLQPYDIRYDCGWVTLICAGCHTDVLVIEP